MLCLTVWMTQTGFPWLAFTIEFPDRTLDLVGAREDEVQQWFLGVQSLAPLSVHHLTMGGVLWQRLIMKLNFYGLVRCRHAYTNRYAATHTRWIQCAGLLAHRYVLCG